MDPTRYDLDCPTVVWSARLPRISKRCHSQAPRRRRSTIAQVVSWGCRYALKTVDRERFSHPSNDDDSARNRGGQCGLEQTNRLPPLANSRRREPNASIRRSDSLAPLGRVDARDFAALAKTSRSRDRRDGVRGDVKCRASTLPSQLLGSAMSDVKITSAAIRVPSRVHRATIRRLAGRSGWRAGGIPRKVHRSTPVRR
jgi:hypothetical protein